MYYVPFIFSENGQAIHEIYLSYRRSIEHLDTDYVNGEITYSPVYKYFPKFYWIRDCRANFDTTLLRKCQLFGLVVIPLNRDFRLGYISNRCDK